VFTSRGSANAGLRLLSERNNPALAAQFLSGFRAALLVCAAISALGIVTSLLRGRGR
jgi:hypothetical protein